MINLCRVFYKVNVGRYTPLIRCPGSNPTKCPKIYRESVLHLLKYRFAVNFGALGICHISYSRFIMRRFSHLYTVHKVQSKKEKLSIVERRVINSKKEKYRTNKRKEWTKDMICHKDQVIPMQKRTIAGNNFKN